MKRLLPFLLILITFYTAYGQTPVKVNPAQKLRLARATYEQGRLHEVPEQLNAAVLQEMNKQEKVSAYTLLCLSYIYLEESEKADESMLNILLSDPYFKPNAAVDPAEFVALYNTFRTYPIYRIGAKIGVNATRPNVIEGVNAVNLSSGSYKALVAFQFGGSLDVPLYFLSKRLTAHADIAFQIKKFGTEIVVDRGESFENTFTSTESQNWLSLPVTFEYELFDLNFHPYIALGASVDYLLKSNVTDAQRQRNNQASIEATSFEPDRQKVNISAIAAAGVKLPISGGFLVFEVRYLYGLSNITTKESAFANAKYTLDYGYADPIFKLNSLAFTGSYVINIFNPKKLKRK